MEAVIVDPRVPASIDLQVCLKNPKKLFVCRLRLWRFLKDTFGTHEIKLWVFKTGLLKEEKRQSGLLSRPEFQVIPKRSCCRAVVELGIGGGLHKSLTSGPLTCKPITSRTEDTIVLAEE